MRKKLEYPPQGPTNADHMTAGGQVAAAGRFGNRNHHQF